MTRVLLILLTALWASAATAQYTAGEFKQAQTRFGLLQIVGQLGRQRVLFNGVDLGIETHNFEIDGVWAVEGGVQDWAVLTAYHGGNACLGFTNIAIMLTEAAAVRTNEFGVCRGAPIALRVTPEAMEIDISDPAPRVTHRIFRFDGTNLTETPIAQAAASRMPGAGADVLRWIGRGPQALTRDAGEQLRFAHLLTPAQMDELNRRLSGPGRVEQIEGWVVGRGCQAHACNVAYALWALRIADGRPLVIFRDDVPGSAFDTQTVFGGEVAQTDPTALAIIMEIAP